MKKKKLTQQLDKILKTVAPHLNFGLVAPLSQQIWALMRGVCRGMADGNPQLVKTFMLRILSKIVYKCHKNSVNDHTIQLSLSLVLFYYLRYVMQLVYCLCYYM